MRAVLFTFLRALAIYASGMAVVVLLVRPYGLDRAVALGACCLIALLLFVHYRSGYGLVRDYKELWSQGKRPKLNIWVFAALIVIGPLPLALIGALGLIFWYELVIIVSGLVYFYPAFIPKTKPSKGHILKALKILSKPALYGVPSIALFMLITRLLWPNHPMTISSALVALTVGFASWYSSEGRERLAKLNREYKTPKSHETHP